MNLNDILAQSEERRRYFMRSSAIHSLPDTRPRNSKKRIRVLAAEIEIIKSKVSMSHFSEPSKEVREKWKSSYVQN